ncbi:isochorismatase family protein [Candidatus Woesearchaeota archaeon]|nr:isochorismatase family protein [Candidatus Woesearchaeota archaeon]
MVKLRHRLSIYINCVQDYPLIALEYQGKGRTTKRLREIIQEVKRHIFIEKDSDDGFTSGTLENLLRKWDVKFLLITGINAAFCVKETAEGAVLRGINIITARQLISDRRYQSIRYAEEWFEENGTYFQDYETLLQTMRSKKEGLEKNLASKSRDTFPLMSQMSRIIKKAASYLPQYTV